MARLFVWIANLRSSVYISRSESNLTGMKRIMLICGFSASGARKVYTRKLSVKTGTALFFTEE